MKKDVTITAYNHSATTTEQSILENKRFIMSVVIPLVGGVSSYGLVAAGMIVYDALVKMF